MIVFARARGGEEGAYGAGIWTYEGRPIKVGLVGKHHMASCVF